MSDTENPYEVESNFGSPINDDVENLAFIRKLMLACVLGSGFTACFLAFAWVMGFYYLYPLTIETWTWLYTTHLFRGTFVVGLSLAFLAWLEVAQISPVASR